MKADPTAPHPVVARNIVFVPEDLMTHATMMKQAGFRTCDASRMIESMAKKACRPITWNFKHLDHKLYGVNGPSTGDARGLSEWLLTRKLKDGFFSEYTTDHMGCLDRVFFEVEGAQEHWRKSEGGRVIFFYTTHGTNEYGMKLGCFTSVDQHGKTILLGASLVANRHQVLRLVF